MNDRKTILDWSSQGALTDAGSALILAGVRPTAHAWRRFLDRLLLWSGALSLAAAVVFFVAYNWIDLGRIARFAMVEVLVLVAVLGYWRLGADTAAGKACLLVASILLGALLALFGQTYQTGADTWQLFATWTALMTPWVLIARFAGLWMLWMAVANVAIILWFQVFPGRFATGFGTDGPWWAVFGFNTAALLAWELAARRLAWMRERWAARLLASASGVSITILLLQAIFGDGGGVPAVAAWPAYAIWLAAAYWAYRVRTQDLFVLSGACLSIIVVAAASLTRLIGDGGWAGSMLLTAMVVIGLAAAFGTWLKSVAQPEAP